MAHGVDMKHANSCKSQMMVEAKESPVALKLIKIQLHINWQKICQILHR